MPPRCVQFTRFYVWITGQRFEISTSCPVAAVGDEKKIYACNDYLRSHLPEMGLAIGAHCQRLVGRFAEALAELNREPSKVGKSIS